MKEAKKRKLKGCKNDDNNKGSKRKFSDLKSNCSSLSDEHLPDETLNYEYSDNESSVDSDTSFQSDSLSVYTSSNSPKNVNNGDNHEPLDLHRTYEPCVANGYIEELCTSKNDYFIKHFNQNVILKDNNSTASVVISDSSSEDDDTCYESLTSDFKTDNEIEEELCNNIDIPILPFQNSLINFKFNSSCLSKLTNINKENNTEVAKVGKLTNINKENNTEVAKEGKLTNINKENNIEIAREQSRSPSPIHHQDIVKKKWDLRFVINDKCITSSDYMFNAIKPFTNYCDEISIIPTTDFKMPLKRPPSRPKRLFNDFTDLILNKEKFVPEDDVISLSCSTITNDITVPKIEVCSDKNSDISSPSSSTSQKKLNYDFSKIPPAFKRICYYYFFNRNCSRRVCIRSHYIEDEAFYKHLMSCSSETLLNGYNWAKKEAHYFYCQIFKTIGSVFSKKQMHGALLQMVNDLFLVDDLDNLTNMDCIVSLLCESMTYKESIMMIINSIDLATNTYIMNILIELLAKHKNLDETCEILQKITENCTQNIDASAIVSLIKKTLRFPKSVNKKLISVINKLITDKHVDAEQIPKDLMTAMETLLKWRTNFTSDMCNDALVDTVIPTFESPFINISIEDNVQYEKLESISQVGIYENESSVESEITQAFSDSNVITGESLNERCNRIAEEFTQKIASALIPPVSQSNTSESSSVLEEEMQQIYGSAIIFTFKGKTAQLHYLLSNAPPRNCVDLQDNDIILLNKAIKAADGILFIDLFESNRNPHIYESFITSTIAAVKSSHDIFNVFINLLNSIYKSNRRILKDNILKAVLEIIALNIIIELKYRCQWKECSTILLKYFTDWDSLLSSRIYTCNLTVMGRYILLAQIFTNAHRFELACEILQSPTLMLLEHQQSWPLSSCPLDYTRRNRVVESILAEGAKYSIITIMELYKSVFEKWSSEDLTQPLLEQFNTTIKTFLDKTSVSSYILYNICLFEPYMDLYILKAYFITLVTKRIAKSKEVQKLFSLCVKRGLYTSHTGEENVVCIKTNYTNEEISLVFENYFKNLAKHPPKEVQIQIELPSDRTNFKNLPLVLQSTYRSMTEIYNNIKEVLKDEYYITIPMIVDSTINLKYDTIENLIDELNKCSM